MKRQDDHIDKNSYLNASSKRVSLAIVQTRMDYIEEEYSSQKTVDGRDVHVVE